MLLWAGVAPWAGAGADGFAIHIDVDTAIGYIQCESNVRLVKLHLILHTLIRAIGPAICVKPSLIIGFGASLRVEFIRIQGH